MAPSTEVVKTSNGNDKGDISCSNCSVDKSRRWMKDAKGNIICRTCHRWSEKHDGMTRPTDKAERDRIRCAKLKETLERKRQEEQFGTEEIDEAGEGKCCSNCNVKKSSRWKKNAEENLICLNCHEYPKYHGGMARPADEAERDRLAQAKFQETLERKRQEEGKSGKHPCKNCKREDLLMWVKNGTGGYDCICRNCYLYFEKKGEQRPRDLEFLRIANLKKAAGRVFKAAKKGKKIPESDKDSEKEPASAQSKRKKMRVAESSSNDRKELDSSVGDKVSGSAAHSDDVGVVSEEAEVEENEESVKEAENALMVEGNEVFEADHGFEANQILDEVVQQGNQILDQVVDEVEPLAEQEENAMETQDAMTVEDEVLEMNPGFEADQILDEVVDDPEADQVEADNVEMVNQPVVLQGAAQLVADEDDDVICIGTVAAPRLIPAIEKDGQLLVVRPNRLTSQAKTFFGRLPRHISRISLSFL